MEFSIFWLINLEEYLHTRQPHDQIYEEIKGSVPANWKPNYIWISAYWVIHYRFVITVYKTLAWRSYLGFPEVNISVAEGGEENLQTNLHGLRRRHFHFFDHQWLSRFPCHRGCNGDTHLSKNSTKEISICPKNSTNYFHN